MKHVIFIVLSWIALLIFGIRVNVEILPDYYQGTKHLHGKQLFMKLGYITAKNHRSLSYKEIWELIEASDEDPHDSANIITLYSRESVPKRCRLGTREAQGCPVKWNREHVWAKSHGFPSENQRAHNDGHHLRASNEYCNSSRGNLDFADGGDLVARCGTSRRSSERPRTWEPPDESKGSVARMMFYMTVRYNGNSQDRTPDLILVDHTTQDGQPQFGKLCVLYGWHKKYPVAPEEKHRNEIVHTVQGNRNPFIDVPEFADRLWHSQCASQLDS